MIITIYILLAEELYTLLYNYWAILGLEIFLAIFWLWSFAVTGSNAHSYEYVDGFYHYGGRFNSTYRKVLRTAAVFGAIEL